MVQGSGMAPIHLLGRVGSAVAAELSHNLQLDADTIEDIQQDLVLFP